jgi:hypothetical protein
VTGFLAEKGSPAPWRLVVVESPFAGARWDVPPDAEQARALRYLRACMADAFSRGEAPFASHGLYTQPHVLDDTIPEERQRGIHAGFAWGALASVRAFYLDLGMSGGMRAGLIEAHRLSQAVEYRRLGEDWEAKPKPKREQKQRPGSLDPWVPGTP